MTSHTAHTFSVRRSQDACQTSTHVECLIIDHMMMILIITIAEAVMGTFIRSPLWWAIYIANRQKYPLMAIVFKYQIIWCQCFDLDWHFFEAERRHIWKNG